MRNFIIILLFRTFLIGCSPIDARQDNGLGHPYIATEQSVKGAAKIHTAELHAFIIPLMLITIPASIIDIYISLITDTVMLPLDLYLDPEDDIRKTISMEES